MTPPRLKVLVADDSQVVHTVFRRIAAQSVIPIDLIGAEDGRQCLEHLNRGDIDLAFIDVNMPEMTGLQAVGAARLTGNKTFVTLMSTDTGAPRLRRHALMFRVYEFLHKPFADADVLAILHTYTRVTAPTNALVVDDSGT